MNHIAGVDEMAGIRMTPGGQKEIADEEVQDATRVLPGRVARQEDAEVEQSEARWTYEEFLVKRCRERFDTLNKAIRQCAATSVGGKGAAAVPGSSRGCAIPDVSLRGV